jgi:hypothetical protein
VQTVLVLAAEMVAQELPHLSQVLLLHEQEVEAEETITAELLALVGQVEVALVLWVILRQLLELQIPAEAEAVAAVLTAVMELQAQVALALSLSKCLTM